MEGRRVALVAVLAAWPAIAACEILSGLSSLQEEPTDAGAATSADGSSGSSGSSGTTPTLEAGPDAADGGGIVVGPGPFAITVTITGTNRGIITSNPPGIDCSSALPDANPPPTCSASFAGGTLVDLNTTIPEAFSWGGDCSDAGDSMTCELLMDAPKGVVGEYSSF